MMNFLSYTAFISAFLIFYIFLGYPLLLSLLCLLFPAPPVRKKNIRPSVSLIISCYNEEDVLAHKLDNSLDLDYPKEHLEIIVVSDGSTDRTDTIALAYKKDGVRLIRKEGRLGKTMCLNSAVREARGEIIVFSDANAMYHSDAIVRLVENFNDETVGYVVGEAKYVDTDKAAAAKNENTYWQYEMWIKKMESRLHSMVGGDGAIYAIRRELYEELLQTDINDFVNPLQIIEKGYRGIYAPEAICLEDAAGSFDKEFRRKIRIVNRAFSGLRRVKGVLNPFKTGFFAFEVMSHKLLRWFLPFFFLTLLGSTFSLAALGVQAHQTLSLIILAFFLVALVGWISAGKSGLLPSYIYLPYYFMTMNVASLFGVIKSLRGDVQYTWDTVRSTDAQQGGRNGATLYVLGFSAVLYLCLVVAAVVRDGAGGGLFFIFWSNVGLICYVYFGYPLILYLAERIWMKPISKGAHLPEVAMLICAYNEEDVIGEKIHNCLNIDYPKEKITFVIASDGSSDRTNSIVRESISDQIVFFPYEERQGKMATILATVPKITSEVVVFSDANTMCLPKAVRKLVQNFSDPSVGAASANVILQNEGTTFGEGENFYYRYERWIQQQESNLCSIVGADGGLFAIRRSLYVPPGPNMILDDFIISMNVALGGHRLIYEPEAQATEKNYISHNAEFSRKSRILAGAVQAIKECQGQPGFEHLRLLFCYFSHKVLRWMIPFFLVALFGANIALCWTTADTLLYRLSLVVQIAFYLLALIGFTGRHREKKLLFTIPFYFCLENFAALHGIFKGFFHRQSGVWDKEKRKV